MAGEYTEVKAIITNYRSIESFGPCFFILTTQDLKCYYGKR